MMCKNVIGADLGPEIDVGAAPEVIIFQENNQKKKARVRFSISPAEME